MEFTDMLPKSIKNPPQIVRHSRPKFHAMLLEQLDKCGIEVEFDKEVVDYFEDATSRRAGVLLKDGSKYEADLVVAADGVRGRSVSLVAGGPVPARSSGNAAFRVAYPVELALADPVIAERFKLKEDGRSVMEMWTGSVLSECNLALANSSKSRNVCTVLAQSRSDAMVDQPPCTPLFKTAKRIVSLTIHQGPRDS